MKGLKYKLMLRASIKGIKEFLNSFDNDRTIGSITNKEIEERAKKNLELVKDFIK